MTINEVQEQVSRGRKRNLHPASCTLFPSILAVKRTGRM